MIVAVSGGKGGTGKTLIAMNLLLALDSAVLFDFDLSNPSTKVFAEDLEEIGKLYMKYPKIIEEKCKKCGMCAKACPFHALVAPSGRFPYLVKDACKGCMFCKNACPFGAIVEEKIEKGIIYRGKIDGKLAFIGEAFEDFEELGILAKDFLKFQEKIKAGVKIFDTGAGLGCEVVNVLAKADVVVLVTEPTPFAYEDLKNQVKVLNDFEKDFVIVVNKLLPSTSYFAEKFKELGEVIEKIPFEKSIAKAYSVGKVPRIRIDKLLGWLNENNCC